MKGPWLFLVLSALLQVGWVVSLRQAQGFTKLLPVTGFVLFGFTSTLFLSKALEGIPMGVAYAVWTGISVAGSVALDLVVFRQVGLARLLCILLILAGTIGLKLAEDVERTEAPASVEKAEPKPAGG